MRQLEMLHEAGRLDVVAVIENEFFVLWRRARRLAELARPQRPVDERHRHRLALGVAERQPIPARELWRRHRRSRELVHHLTLGHGELADRDRESELLGYQLELDLADADLRCERVIASVAALRRVAQCEEEALVGASQVLEPHVARRGKNERLPRHVADDPCVVVRSFGLDETLAIEDVHHPRGPRNGRPGSAIDGGYAPLELPRPALVAARRSRAAPRFWAIDDALRRPLTLGAGQRKIEQTMGVVERGAEDLS